MRQFGDGIGIEVILGRVEQRLEHFVGYAVARDGVQIERQKGLVVHHVGIDGIDEELKHYAVGEDGERVVGRAL